MTDRCPFFNVEHSFKWVACVLCVSLLLEIQSSHKPLLVDVLLYIKIYIHHKPRQDTLDVCLSTLASPRPFSSALTILLSHTPIHTHTHTHRHTHSCMPYGPDDLFIEPRCHRHSIITSSLDHRLDLASSSSIPPTTTLNQNAQDPLACRGANTRRGQ